MGPCFRECSVSGCAVRAVSRGMCMDHYQDWYRNEGKPKGLVTRHTQAKTPMGKLFENTIIDPETGCYEWQRGVSSYGYGRIRLGDRRTFAHVLAYETLIGSVPEGWDIDHLCRNAKCWNVDHLEAVPHRINILRGNTLAAKWTALKHPDCICSVVGADICPDHGVIIPPLEDRIYA